jgi:hypothetical protein
MPVEKIASVSHDRPNKRSRLLGIGVGVLLSFLLLTAVSTAYFSGIFVSANNQSPTELIIRNVGDTSAEIYWGTQDETQGLVEYGTNPSELTLIAPEIISAKEHIQILSLLQPSTTYYFRIKIGDKVFDDGGVPWTFSTKESDSEADAIFAEPEDVALDEEGETDPIVEDNGLSCPQTDNCDEIKNQLGTRCQTSDYLRCLQKSQ